MSRLRQGVYGGPVDADLLQRRLPALRLSPSGRSSSISASLREDGALLSLPALRDPRLREEPRRQTGKVLLAPLRAAVLEAFGNHSVPGCAAYLFLQAVWQNRCRRGAQRPQDEFLQRRLPHTMVFCSSKAGKITIIRKESEQANCVLTLFTYIIM